MGVVHDCRKIIGVPLFWPAFPVLYFSLCVAVWRIEEQVCIDILSGVTIFRNSHFLTCDVNISTPGCGHTQHSPPRYVTSSDCTCIGLEQGQQQGALSNNDLSIFTWDHLRHTLAALIELLVCVAWHHGDIQTPTDWMSLKQMSFHWGSSQRSIFIFDVVGIVDCIYMQSTWLSVQASCCRCDRLAFCGHGSSCQRIKVVR